MNVLFGTNFDPKQRKVYFKIEIIVVVLLLVLLILKENNNSQNNHRK